MCEGCHINYEEPVQKEFGRDTEKLTGREGTILKPGEHHTFLKWICFLSLGKETLFILEYDSQPSCASESPKGHGQCLGPFQTHQIRISGGEARLGLSF